MPHRSLHQTLASPPTLPHIKVMLKFAPILLALAYGYIMVRFSAWRTARELDRNSTELADPILKTHTAAMAKALDVEIGGAVGAGEGQVAMGTTNAEVLARYAAIVQSRGMVPIVEPEVLMDGDHDMERCAEVTEAAQSAVFEALRRHHVRLECVILKPNMILPGKGQPRPTPEACADATLRVLRRTVPAAVPTINFLSGGQTSEEATANLNAMNRADGAKPWVLSFSYSRALQNPVQAAWQGDPANKEAAQRAFLHRARLNSLARKGEYDPSMETPST